MATYKRPIKRTKTVSDGTKAPRVRTFEVETPKGGTLSGTVIPTDKRGTEANRGRKVGAGSSGNAHTNRAADHAMPLHESRRKLDGGRSTEHHSGSARGASGGSIRGKSNKF